MRMTDLLKAASDGLLSDLNKEKIEAAKRLLLKQERAKEAFEKLCEKVKQDLESTSAATSIDQIKKLFEDVGLYHFQDNPGHRRF